MNVLVKVVSKEEKANEIVISLEQNREYIKQIAENVICFFSRRMEESIMIANGNYMQKEIAYCGERELEDMGYLPVRENVSEILEHLLRIASDNPHLEKEFEEYHKGVYQDNYYDSVDGVEYCIQHDIVTNDCVLYELKEMGK